MSNLTTEKVTVANIVTCGDCGEPHNPKDPCPLMTMAEAEQIFMVGNPQSNNYNPNYYNAGMRNNRNSTFSNQGGTRQLTNQNRPAQQQPYPKWQFNLQQPRKPYLEWRMEEFVNSQKKASDDKAISMVALTDRTKNVQNQVARLAN